MEKDPNSLGTSYSGKQDRIFEMRAPPRRRTTNKEKESQDSDNQPLFLRKAFVMITNCPPDIGGWSDAGDTVIIKDVKRFEEHVIPTVYKHNNFSSFVRQLNFYGFRKVKSVECADQPASSLWEFRHPSFLRGQPHLLSEIKRAMHYAGDASNSTEVQDLKNQVANLTDIVSRLKEQVDDLSEVVAALRQGDASASSSFAGSDIEYKKRKVVGVKSSAPYGGGKGGDRKVPMLNNFEVSSDHEDDIYAEALDVGSLNVFMEEWKLLSENSLSGPGGGGKHKGDLKSSASRTAASSSSSSAAVGPAAGPDKLDFTHLLESLPSDLKVRFVDQLADQFGKQLTGASGLTAQHSTSSSSSNMQVFQQYLNHNPNSNLSSTMDSSFYANQSFNPSAMNTNSNFQEFPMQNHVQMFSSEGASQGNALDISLPLASAALGAFMSNVSGFEQFSSNDAGGNNGSSNDISNNDNILNSLPDSLDNWYFNI